MRYAALLVSTFLFFGCSTFGQSTFVDGTFHSPQPDLTLKLNGYDDIGKMQYSKDVYDALAGAHGETYYVSGEKHYLVKGDQNRISSLVAIDIQSYPSSRRVGAQNGVLGSLLGLLVGDSQERLPEESLVYREDVAIGHSRGVLLVKAETPDADASTLKFPLSRGYTLPDCLLVASWMLQGGAGNQYNARIDYYEDLPETLGPCKTWSSTDMLSEEQVRYLSDFEGRLTKILQFTAGAGAPPPDGKGALKEKLDSAMERKLRELKRLLDEGLITKEEYDQKRKEVLERF